MVIRATIEADDFKSLVSGDPIEIVGFDGEKDVKVQLLLNDIGFDVMQEHINIARMDPCQTDSDIQA